MRKIFLLSIIANIAFSSLWAQIQLHVSPKGKDSGSGTEQSPFRTIERARDEAYRAKGDVTVFLHEGTYRLSTPLVFTPNGGGATEKNLAVRSYPGEKAVISGSLMLKNLQWKPYKNGILQAKISGSPAMDMLIVNGEIRPQARYPNYDPDAIRFNGTAGDVIAPERVKTWENPAGGYLHVMHSHDWGDFHYRITGKDGNGNVRTEGGWQNNRQSGWHNANRMVENIFEELDAPGEWFYNAAKSTLYYYPLEGEDASAAVFESPQLKHLVELRGTEGNPVRNVTFEGLDFTQTLRTFMEKYEPLLRSDWTIYRGAAIFFEGAERCALRNCNIYNVGGNAVFFSGYNRRCEVSGSHLTSIGASAVCFVGYPDAVRSPSFEYSQFVAPEDMDRAVGPKTNSYPAHCRVHDNLIHNIGLYEKQTTGVELSMSRAVTVSHNSIYDTPRAGINVSEGTWGGHIIEFNDVFNTVKETGDHGSFNSWGRDRFWHPRRELMDSLLRGDYTGLILADAVETTVIRNNRFRCDRGWDIDLDDGSTNYHIYNNLCLNGGLKLREGFYRVVENNILVNNTFHCHVWFKNNGVVFTRNIVMGKYEQTADLELRGALIDYNIFTDSLSYSHARRHGSDANSVVLQPEFINPAFGDFRVAANSVDVFRIGFQNFDMSSFGVESDRLKAIAGQPQMPVLAFAAGGAHSKTITWESVKVKNLETLGERSSTGMDSERGVYVVSIEAYGSELRDFLKANDVILGFAGKVVNSLSDLHSAVAGADLTQPQQMTIYRNQKENVITIPGGVIRSAVNLGR